MAKKPANKEPGLPSLALVFGYIAVKDLKRLEDRLTVLNRLGYGNAAMAVICDASPGRIGTLKSRAARQRRGLDEKESEGWERRRHSSDAYLSVCRDRGRSQSGTECANSRSIQSKRLRDCKGMWSGGSVSSKCE